MLFCAVSQAERREVALKVYVASHCPIFRNDQQSLVFRPSQSSYGAFVPVNFANQLAGATVYVDGGFGSLGAAKGVDLACISVDCCASQPCSRRRIRCAYLQHHCRELQ